MTHPVDVYQYPVRCADWPRCEVCRDVSDGDDICDDCGATMVLETCCDCEGMGLDDEGIFDCKNCRGRGKTLVCRSGDRRHAND